MRRVPMRLFSRFLKDLAANKIKKVYMTVDKLIVVLRNAENGHGNFYHSMLLPVIDRRYITSLLLEHHVEFGAIPPPVSGKLTPILLASLPFIYLLLMYRMMGKLFNKSGDGVGKKPIKDSVHRKKVYFDDVAGIDAAKIELEEVVDALRNPIKYQAVGAKMPRGILLCGPPGNGKTLLARALATEAGVPFMFCSASDFVEMLVGRGAARVRDLFTKAAECTSCIIFIDELDALAKARGGLNSNDEREQTLNQLLTEMDGFEGRSDGVIVIAATNRPHILDPALCRPGRFDRHVFVQLPNENGRLAILNVHVRSISMGSTVNLEKIAAETEDFSGADLSTLVNDAALMAVRNGSRVVEMCHFKIALSRSIESKSMFISSIRKHSMTC